MYFFWPYCPPIVFFFLSKSGHLFCGKQYQVMACTVIYSYLIYIYIYKSNNVFKGREKREGFYYSLFSTLALINYFYLFVPSRLFRGSKIPDFCIHSFITYKSKTYRPTQQDIWCTFKYIQVHCITYH